MGACVPQATAMASLVVGRVTPGLANSVSDSALNRLDLPEPVAPASDDRVISGDRQPLGRHDR